MSRSLSVSPLRIVVTGLMAQYPLAGVAWDYLQYVVGLARLGHDVYYIEDTGQWPYSPSRRGTAEEPGEAVAHLARIMDRFGLGDAWAYRFPWQSQWFGLSETRRRDVLRTADLILNVSGTLERPQDYKGQGRLVYIDSDPVFTQVKLARGQEDFQALVDAHDIHFSFGERLGPPVPQTGHVWRATRQPILLDQWANERPAGTAYTTVMNWTSFNDVKYDGRVYGQKDVEFKRFLGLPHRVAPVQLECALNTGKTRRAPVELLRHQGWKVVDPEVVCPDLDGYRDYIVGSRGEWSVAKNGYVQGSPAWFSCRSACYLAAGRPVIAENTGFPDVLPVGEGLFAFSDEDEAAEAIDAVEGDIARHSKAARSLAGEYFDSDVVLSALVEEAMTAETRP